MYSNWYGINWHPNAEQSESWAVLSAWLVGAYCAVNVRTCDAPVMDTGMDRSHRAFFYRIKIPITKSRYIQNQINNLTNCIFVQ